MRSDRGEALVEFAFASVIFFAVLFGAISGGISVLRYNMLASVAQDAARYGSVRGASSSTNFKAQGDSTTIRSTMQQRYPLVPITSLQFYVGNTATEPKTMSTGTKAKVVVQSTWLPISRYVPWTAFTFSATSEMVVTR